jgi:hypothetical protein
VANYNCGIISLLSFISFALYISKFCYCEARCSGSYKIPATRETEVGGLGALLSGRASANK